MSATQWHLLTGSQKDIYALAKQQYFAGDTVGFYQSGNEFLHTENFILIDNYFTNVNELNKSNLNYLSNLLKSENEYDIKWNIIENTIQNVKHIISNIEPIEPIQCTPQHNIKQGRNPSHRKKNPKERQFKLSHHKQYKQRKMRVAKC